MERDLKSRACAWHVVSLLISVTASNEFLQLAIVGLHMWLSGFFNGLLHAEWLSGLSVRLALTGHLIASVCQTNCGAPVAT